MCHWSISSRGGLARVDVNISKQCVACADLELAPGVVEEPLIEPLGRIAQRDAAAEDGMIGFADEVPGAVALRAGAAAGSASSIQTKSDRRAASLSAGVGLDCRRRPSPWPPRPRSSCRSSAIWASTARSAAACFARRHLGDRCPFGGIAVERGTVDVVEEREELVVVLRPDRVVLVVVAAGAAGGQAEEDGAVGIDLVDDVADVDLLLDRAAFVGRNVAAVVAGGDDLVGGRVGQQVAGQLLDDELVEGLVGVEGVDDPVAVGPDLAVVVEVQAVGVAVAGGVEPEPRHVLAVAGRVEQAVDDLLVSVAATSRRGRRRPPARVGGRPVRSSVTRRINVVLLGLGRRARAPRPRAGPG